jgi:hypothetical protein
MLDEAAKLNAANGSLEGRLQLAEYQADFLEIQGDREEAKALAAKTYGDAQWEGERSLHQFRQSASHLQPPLLMGTDSPAHCDNST